FGSGGPSKTDDGVNSTFLGSRLALNGTTVQALISRIAPAFSAMLGKQLASKAVPLIGAVAGASVNFAFTRYYEEIALVRFGVKRLVLDHGEDRIHHAFRAAMAKKLGED
ncbi:MAG: protein EcsC, partial [Paracoccaceae bacterium]